MAFTIESERLTLRYLRPTDLPAMTALWGDSAVARFMGDFGPRTPGEVAEWLDGQVAATEPPGRAGSMNLAVCRTIDSALVGWLGLGTDDRGLADWDFGYITHPQHRGQGYATEALGAAIRYCIDVLGLDSLWGQCDPSNVASAHVMTGAGMLEIESSTTDRRFRIARDAQASRHQTPEAEVPVSPSARTR